MYYSIKQVSDKMNMPAYTLRYYEKEGLLPSIRRSRGGIRRFTEEDLDWLGLICDPYFSSEYFVREPSGRSNASSALRYPDGTQEECGKSYRFHGKAAGKGES